MKTCAAASEYISCFLRNVWLLLVVFQCFFNERAAVSEKLFKRKKGASERYQLYIKKKICSCLWQLKKYFEVKTD